MTLSGIGKFLERQKRMKREMKEWKEGGRKESSRARGDEVRTGAETAGFRKCIASTL